MFAFLHAPHSRNPKLLRSIGAGVSITLGLACETTSDSPDRPAACEVLDAAVDEVECGTYEDSDEGCGGSDSGGSDSGGTCEADEASNDAVVACVAQAAGDGVAFTFDYHYRRYFGTIDTANGYHVGADGSLWRSSVGASDACNFDRTAVYPSVDPSTCGSLDCIRAAGEVEELAVCSSEGNC